LPKVGSIENLPLDDAYRASYLVTAAWLFLFDSAIYTEKMQQ